jgi:ApbE superfamily uncharacterized protein (UPF0280 family)
MKRIALVVTLLALTASAAIAAPLTGKVIAVDKERIQVVAKGKLESWVKKGGKVRLLEGRGIFVGVASDTLTIEAKVADKVKVGDEIELRKPRPGVSGC